MLELSMQSMEISAAKCREANGKRTARPGGMSNGLGRSVSLSVSESAQSHQIPINDTAICKQSVTSLS